MKLTLKKKILEIMGSQITLSSDGKSGSTFSFSINFKKLKWLFSFI